MFAAHSPTAAEGTGGAAGHRGGLPAPPGAEKGRAWAGFPPAARPAPPASAGAPADASPGIRRRERAAAAGPSVRGGPAAALLSAGDSSFCLEGSSDSLKVTQAAITRGTNPS